ncbi:hypothetical protein BCR34DRAFT_186942 [Clohesyomyces aquaticus]|uniref:Uncharacterized protein n=1 Tax=Clohesyomyces aquaticus TaxID=1231657 RepID=A0A1Y1YE57_9PLEO|nr:hypothetical protein BCR34DRAFT_186942 [Clohesyomyces aquaticus]
MPNQTPNIYPNPIEGSFAPNKTVFERIRSNLRVIQLANYRKKHEESAHVYGTWQQQDHHIPPSFSKHHLSVRRQELKENGIVAALALLWRRLCGRSWKAHVRDERAENSDETNYAGDEETGGLPTPVWTGEGERVEYDDEEHEGGGEGVGDGAEYAHGEAICTILGCSGLAGGAIQVGLWV